MGTIEISQKIDEFKIRLKILELTKKLMNDTNEKFEIRRRLIELEIEFDKFIEEILK